MPSTVSIAILSDLHVVDTVVQSANVQREEPRSYIVRQSRFPSEPHDPLADLVTLISNESLRADVVLSLGDMTDQARPDPTHYAWHAIHEISTRLDAGDLLAVSGNHDIDSRSLYTPPDPLATLRKLRPPFPLSASAEKHEYWADHFTVLERDTVRIVLLNSCAWHATKEEREHGRITPETLAMLRQRLLDTQEKPLNLLVCHHHPYKHHYPADFAPDYQAIENGPVLLEMLEEVSDRRWVVVHGHRHFSNIAYAAGAANSPVVMAAGSLGFVLPTKQNSQVANQFHHLTTYLDHPGLPPVCGIIRSWDWVHGPGWVPTNRFYGLPHVSGFGVVDNARQLADEVSGRFKTQIPISWALVEKELPKLAFLMPSDFKKLRAALREHHGLAIADLDHAPFQLGRIP
jgi:predicted phosphodiesterase